MRALQETLANSFFQLGLSESQENFIQDLIGSFMNNMADLQNRGVETQMTLKKLNSNLSKLRSQ